jgi:hypothetical protein
MLRLHQSNGIDKEQVPLACPPFESAGAVSRVVEARS